MRKEGVVHMPSSLGCRVSHSSVVTVETIGFIKNKQSILVARPLYRKEYFHSPTCGTSTILVHLPCTKLSWSTPVYRRPNLSHCKLFGRRNHHDFVEFRFFKKTYCTRNTASTREDWTALYHVISLKPTRPN